MLAVAYLVAPSTQGWAYNGFVPEDLLPYLAFSAAIAIGRRSLPWSILIAQGMLGVKEDEAYFVAWLGFWIAACWDRRIGIALGVLAILNGAAYYAVDVHFGYLPERPQYGLVDRDGGHQLLFLIEVLVPLAFAPLRLGVRMLVALPFLAELFLAQQRPYPLYGTGSYYTIPLVTVCIVGTAIVAGRRPAFARGAIAGSALMAMFFNTTVLHFGRRPFAPDPQYAVAERWSRTNAQVDFPCEDEGAWTVAAADPNARLACPGTATQDALHTAARPARAAWLDEPLASPARWAHVPFSGAGTSAPRSRLRRSAKPGLKAKRHDGNRRPDRSIGLRIDPARRSPHGKRHDAALPRDEHPRALAERERRAVPYWKASALCTGVDALLRRKAERSPPVSQRPSASLQASWKY